MNLIVTARVVRYGVAVEGALPLHRGDFDHTLARWWVPFVGAHDAAFWPVGIARGYYDHADGLDVDFLTADPILAARILDHDPIEFSIGFSYPPDPDRAYLRALDHVAVCEPPRRGACPGTGVLAIRETADVWTPPVPAPRSPEMQPRRRWWKREPAPASTRPISHLKRYGERREDFDPVAYWERAALRRMVRPAPASSEQFTRVLDEAGMDDRASARLLLDALVDEARADVAGP